MPPGREPLGWGPQPDWNGPAAGDHRGGRLRWIVACTSIIDDVENAGLDRNVKSRWRTGGCVVAGGRRGASSSATGPTRSWTGTAVTTRCPITRYPRSRVAWSRLVGS